MTKIKSISLAMVLKMGLVLLPNDADAFVARTGNALHSPMTAVQGHWSCTPIAGTATVRHLFLLPVVVVVVVLVLVLVLDLLNKSNSKFIPMVASKKLSMVSWATIVTR
jgi:hypothetical protein